MKPIPSVQQLCRRRGSCGGMKIASRGAKFSSKEGGKGAFPHILRSSLRRHGETYFVVCLRGHTEKFGYFQLSLNPSRAIVCYIARLLFLLCAVVRAWLCCALDALRPLRPPHTAPATYPHGARARPTGFALAFLLWFLTERRGGDLTLALPFLLPT